MEETKGKIKQVYDEIESPYPKHVVSAVEKVKERPLLNAAVKMLLFPFPFDPNLRKISENIGGRAKSEENKTKRILQFKLTKGI